MSLLTEHWKHSKIATGWYYIIKNNNIFIILRRVVNIEVSSIADTFLVSVNVLAVLLEKSIGKGIYYQYFFG